MKEKQGDLGLGDLWVICVVSEVGKVAIVVWLAGFSEPGNIPTNSPSLFFFLSACSVWLQIDQTSY